MRKFLLGAPLLFLVLAACAPVDVIPAATPDKISQRIYEAELEFRYQANRAAEYLRQDECEPQVRVVLCADPAVSKGLRDILHRGSRALDLAWDAWRAGRDPGGSLAVTRELTGALINKLLTSKGK